VLSFLGDGDGHPMTAIAEFAMLPPPTLTKVVDRMVSLNLVLAAGGYRGTADGSWSSSRPWPQDLAAVDNYRGTRARRPRRSHL